MDLWVPKGRVQRGNQLCGVVICACLNEMKRDYSSSVERDDQLPGRVNEPEYVGLLVFEVDKARGVVGQRFLFYQNLDSIYFDIFCPLSEPRDDRPDEGVFNEIYCCRFVPKKRGP